MTATFSHDYDVTRHMMRSTLSGFFSPADVAAVAADRETVYQRAGLMAGTHVTLIDVSACALQQQEVVAAFHQMMDDPRFRSRRLAIVTGSSLARMQVRRIITRPGVRMFEDRGSAEAWLLSADEDSAAA